MGTKTTIVLIDVAYMVYQKGMDKKDIYPWLYLSFCSLSNKNCAIDTAKETHINNWGIWVRSNLIFLPLALPYKVLDTKVRKISIRIGHIQIRL